MNEIYTGGSSYNFCILTQSGKYFMKLCKNDKIFSKLKCLYLFHNVLHKVKNETFGQYKILIMPFISGQKIHYRHCSNRFIENLCSAYQKVQTCQINADFIAPMRNMQQLRSELETLFQAQKSILSQCIYKNIWKLMETEVLSLAESKAIIHGDFTANNILVTADEQPYILDWEQLRYGYAAEDFACLALELTGFRGLYGCLSRFERIMREINKHLNISPQEWFYGVQVFYLSLLQRRLANRKKQSWRKQLCLWLIMRGYFRVCRLLQTRF
ncbi:MAG: phosphotransferase [Alphaproteobacteria bacterium]|nr:phosphotransferase [Alphaproteobacteria bacterium]